MTIRIGALGCSSIAHRRPLPAPPAPPQPVLGVEGAEEGSG
jgi:hypothetical protein